ncbi:hypothetical protein PV326_009383, partial [Microctonus aethiopoides]
MITRNAGLALSLPPWNHAVAESVCAGEGEGVALPTTKPTIRSERRRYALGDVLEANCSLPPSRPTVEFSFTLNNLPQGRSTLGRPSHKAKIRSFENNQYTSENATEYTSTSANKWKSSNELVSNVEPSMNYCITQFTAIFCTLQQLLNCKECNGD